MRWLVLAGVACVIVGCGGGGGDDYTTGPVTAVAPPIGALDGFVDRNAQANTAVGIYIGDDEGMSGTEMRGFVTFDIAWIPAGATIQSATLRVNQDGIPLADPYPTHGSLWATSVDIGPTLDVADYDGTQLGAHLTISTTSALGWKTVDVTADVTADRTAGRSRSSFRLEFSIFDGNGDGQSQYISVTDAEGSNGQTTSPELVVTYQP